MLDALAHIEIVGAKATGDHASYQTAEP